MSLPIEPTLTDFPKIHCPFIRQTFKVNPEDWKKKGPLTKRASKTGATDKVMAEGVVFYNFKRRAERKTWMAKLRRDMFDWFYSGIEIQGYDAKGRDEVEDQEKFD